MPNDFIYLTRTIEPTITELTTQFPVLLLTGPRQVGKTSILQHLKEPNRTYVSLDDPTISMLAKNDPAIFLQKYKPPLIIDEIQYAPELLPYIKIMVDNSKQQGLFWLTGSQKFHLMQGVSESLAGRIAIIDLLGLSQKEITKNPNMNKPFIPEDELLQQLAKTSSNDDVVGIFDKICRGSFPKLINDPTISTEIFYSSYIQTYIERDIRQLANIRDTGLFLKFLQVAAARTGNLLNLNDLACETEISINTAKNWLAILEASGIIYLLQPYFSNISKRLIKTPKLYFLDTGLCCYLTNWFDARSLEASAMSGNLLETWVISEIIKSYWHNGKKAPIYFYRDKDKKEIDLIININNKLFPIEIKKTANPKKAFLKNFNLLDKTNLRASGGIICFYNDLLPITKDTYSIPVNII